MRYPKGLACLLALNLALFGACQCEDDVTLGPDWRVEEQLRPLDFALPAPDLGPQPDMPPEERVIIPVSPTIAQTDRTSLGIGEDGRVWVAFHRCSNPQCDVSYLTVAQISNTTNQPITLEDVTPQEGTFGLEVAGNQPWLAFLDPNKDQFSVAARTGEDRWRIEPVDANYMGAFDGLDLTYMSGNMYVTFAHDGSNSVDLFAYNLADNSALNPTKPFQRAPLVADEPSAALERGLRATDQGELYLIHQDKGNYALSSYNLEENRWRNAYTFEDRDLIVSSLLFRRNGEACLSYTRSQFGFLRASCGPKDDLEKVVWDFDGDVRVNSYSSMVEAPDGRLVVVYSAINRSALRIAVLDPDTGEYTISTIHDSFASGVSAGIDAQGRLAISYYKCDRDQNCRLALTRLSEY